VVFLKAGSTKAAIQQLWLGMPNTPGKVQEVAGVEVISAAFCHAQVTQSPPFGGSGRHTGFSQNAPHRLENLDRLAIPRPKLRE
jgi:hypothetical protein